jgi:hypothetical protein
LIAIVQIATPGAILNPHGKHAPGNALPPSAWHPRRPSGAPTGNDAEAAGNAAGTPDADPPGLAPGICVQAVMARRQAKVAMRRAMST